MTLFYSGLFESLRHWQLRRRDRLEMRRWRDSGSLNRSKCSVGVLFAIHMIESLFDGDVIKVEIGLWINGAPPFVRNNFQNGNVELDANFEPENIESISSRVLDTIDSWEISREDPHAPMLGTALIKSGHYCKKMAVSVRDYHATDEEWDREERYIDACLESNTPPKRNLLPSGTLITLKLESVSA